LLAIDALTIEVPFSGQISLRSAVGEQSDLYQVVFGSQLDVHFPTTDWRTLILSRYTHPEPEQRILLEQLKLSCRPNRHRASALAESSWNRNKTSLL
jgi:hypothetical protein